MPHATQMSPGGLAARESSGGTLAAANAVWHSRARPGGPAARAARAPPAPAA